MGQQQLWKQKKSWFKELGWKSNPFTLEIHTESFVPQKDEIEKIISNIENRHKHILITGSTGVGKTTLLRWIKTKYNSFYIPKPPLEDKEIITVFRTEILKKGFFERLLNREDDLNLYNLTERYNNRYKGEPMLLLIDEAHETRLQTLEWIRSLTEQMEGLTLILTGLPRLKTEYLRHLETLMQRITADIELKSLTREETIELMKKRIDLMGGKGIEPFTIDSAIEIYNQTGGFPREILKMCDSLIDKALEENKRTIDLSVIGKEDNTVPSKGIKEKLEEITGKQKEIITIISENYPMSPPEIIKNISVKDYKTKMHALRATNNILKRMVDLDILTRKKEGKAFIYNITPKIRSILVKA